MARKTLTIDDDLHAAVKEIANSTNRTMGQVFSDLARQGLALERTEARREVHGGSIDIEKTVSTEFLDRHFDKTT